MSLNSAGYKNKLQILCTLGGETIRTKMFTTQKCKFLTVWFEKGHGLFLRIPTNERKRKKRRAIEQYHPQVELHWIN